MLVSWKAMPRSAARSRRSRFSGATLITIAIISPTTPATWWQ